MMCSSRRARCGRAVRRVRRGPRRGAERVRRLGGGQLGRPPVGRRLDAGRQGPRGGVRFEATLSNGRRIMAGSRRPGSGSALDGFGLLDAVRAVGAGAPRGARPGQGRGRSSEGGAARATPRLVAAAGEGGSVAGTLGVRGEWAGAGRVLREDECFQRAPPSAYATADERVEQARVVARPSCAQRRSKSALGPVPQVVESRTSSVRACARPQVPTFGMAVSAAGWWRRASRHGRPTGRAPS